MADPFWVIMGVIAIACVLLWPIRAWRASRYDPETRDADGTPPEPTNDRDGGGGGEPAS
jgi:hypothetical protein